MASDPSLAARLLQSPRVGFGLTTVALVALASSGTGILVSHGASQLQPDAQRVVPPPRTPSPAAGPVLVERAPGSLVLPSPLIDGTARAIHRALVSAPRQLPRTVTAPLVPVGPPEQVVVPVPVVNPPVVTPPVDEPPVVEPPVVEPNTKHGHKAHPAHPDDQGKHLGQLKH